MMGVEGGCFLPADKHRLFERINRASLVINEILCGLE